MSRSFPIALLGWLASLLGPGSSGFANERISGFLAEHCVDCHSAAEPESGVDLESVTLGDWSSEAPVLERALRKMQARQMPPADYSVPSDEDYRAVIAALAEKLDAHAAANPKPGRPDALRRLTATEYQNAIHDLLDVQIDAREWLPVDAASHGFDNMTVDSLSPTLMNRYVTAAQKISRMAVGNTGRGPLGQTIRIKPDITQDSRLPGMPPGTRGGAVIETMFPASGTYRLSFRLARDRNEHVEGLSRPHTMEVLWDRECVADFVVRPAKDGNHSLIDAELKTELAVEAGLHTLAVTFVQDSWSLQETMRQPLESHFNTHRHPRQGPALYEVSILGPLESLSPEPGWAPEMSNQLLARRREVFGAWPTTAEQELPSATAIIQRLARRAFRRPVDDADIARPMSFYAASRASGGDFAEGLESAISAILVSPNFLFRIETAPVTGEAGEAENERLFYAISDLELASRLSFFVWGSIPDDRLLDLAEQGRLHEPQVLAEQVGRLLADERSSNLVTNFAAQWLYLRNLDSITPDARAFPDFDDNLRQAFRQETELRFNEMLREDQSVLGLIKSSHTYLNERLAKHYGIAHVYGPRFRKVDLPVDSVRGGLLRHASILTVTSYATRTSPVIRGNWILENLLASAPPPPPADVPALEDSTVAADLPIRQRLAAHRDNAACAGCHNLMDPVGFALENFDAIGRWRELDAGEPIDASGGLPGRADFVGVAGLEDALLHEPGLFVSALTEKLLTFAIGREIEASDGASIRKIVRDASQHDYRFSSIVQGIVDSPAFRMREF